MCGSKIHESIYKCEKIWKSTNTLSELDNPYCFHAVGRSLFLTRTFLNVLLIIHFCLVEFCDIHYLHIDMV